MIFEFLKRLFWKADEGNRKRKISENVTSTEDQIFTKKRRHDFISSNHVKIFDKTDKESRYKYNQSRFNSSARSSLNSKQFKIEMHNNKKFESMETVSLYSPSITKRISEADKTITKTESMNQFTLYNTIRLSERKQYSDMLLNFVPSDIENNDEESHKIMNQKNSNKNKSLREKSFDNEHDKSLKILSQPNQKSLIIHNSQKFLRPESQKHVFLNDLYCEQKNNVPNEEINQFVKSTIRNPPIEIIQTNSLRDKLSSKQVIKENFISQISEKYEERMKQCNRELKELKKLTCLLSIHNQLSREAAFEDHLNRSMRLCEAVLDERLPEEDSKLPELTLDMKERIKFALSLGNADEVLVEGFGLRITRKDIQTLAGLNWLNDEVINFYMNLLMTRSSDKKYPNVYAMNTFFYPKLISGGHSSLKRWTRKVDIFSKDLIVIPIHLGIHWCMSIIDFRNKSIQYFDSMGSPNYKCLQVLKQYLYDESIDKKKKSFDFIDWSFECMKNIPQQMNGSDCGVFSCMFAEYICSNKQINFTQDDMPYFRNKMIYEIVTTQLL